MKNLFCLMILGALVLSGCATPTVYSKKLSANEVETGVTYYLPKQLYNVTYTQTEECEFGLSIEAGALVADTKHRYVLSPIQSGFRDDTFKFDTNTNGLLTKSKTTATGVGDKIIISIAETAAALGIMGVDGQKCQAVKAVNAIDPTLESDRDAVDFLASRANRTIIWDPALDDAEQDVSDDFNGVYYRRALPYQMVVGCLEAAGANCVPQAISLSLPQGSPTERLQPLGSAFATDSDEFTFTNGMLTSADSARKSEFTTIASLPLKAIKAVLEVPADLLTLRTKNVTAENAQNTALEKLLNQSLVDEANRLNAETTALEAQNKLATKERELEKARIDRLILEQCVILAGDDVGKIQACFP